MPRIGWPRGHALARHLRWALAAGLAVARLAAAAADVPQNAPLSAPPLDARFFGIHLHRADTTTPWPFVKFGSWRLWDAGVDWAKLEPMRGRWRFDKLDRLMALAQVHEVEPMLTLAVTPAWAAARPSEPFVYGAGGASEPRDLADWEAYVRQVATRYKGRLRYLEIWNEPKYSDIEPTKGAFFSGTVKNLVDLACAAQRTARAVDQDLRIVGPGFTGAGDRLERFLAAGGKHCIDVVAFHFYSATPEKMQQRIADVRQIMQAQGVAHLPLWNTEQGYEVLGPDARLPGPQGIGVADEATEAAYIVRSFALAADAGLGRFHFYSWERMLDKSQKPRRGALAVATAVRWLRGARLPGCRALDTLRVCPLERGGRKAWLVWTTGPAFEWRVPPTWQIKAIEPMEGPGRDHHNTPLQIGQAPLLLKQDAPAWRP